MGFTGNSLGIDYHWMGIGPIIFTVTFKYLSCFLAAQALLISLLKSADFPML